MTEQAVKPGTISQPQGIFMPREKQKHIYIFGGCQFTASTPEL